MSNIQVTKPATLPATTGKLFKAFNAPAFIAGTLPHDDSERCTPSMIKCNKALAIAGLGGKTTAPAFITGLLYALSAHAYGQAQIDTLAQSLPAWAVHCLKAGADVLPAGKGANVGQIKSACTLALNAMLTLPARAAPEKVNSKTEQVTLSASASNAAPREYLAQDAMLCNPPMDADGEQAVRYAGRYLRDSQAFAETRAKSEAWRSANEEVQKTEWRNEQAAMRALDVMTERATAVAEFLKLAEFLGVKLSTVQRKALAA